MVLSFLKVTNKEQQQTVANLASEIWHEHFTPIIGQEQVQYMLAHFQSAHSIAQQIQDGFIYYLLLISNQNIGYICFQTSSKELFLSKFYLLEAYRHQGFGKQALAFIEQQARDAQCRQIRLTVNKNNTNTIKAYKKMGFIHTTSVIKDIGGGFVMDDYEMVKNIV